MQFSEQDHDPLGLVPATYEKMASLAFGFWLLREDKMWCTQCRPQKLVRSLLVLPTELA